LAVAHPVADDGEYCLSNEAPLEVGRHSRTFTSRHAGERWPGRYGGAELLEHDAFDADAAARFE
jgi:hypothetical protein